MEGKDRHSTGVIPGKRKKRPSREPDKGEMRKMKRAKDVLG